jgi:SAM-dependent methyltransferase
MESANDLVKEKYENTAPEYFRKERRRYWLDYNLEKLRTFLNTHSVQQVIDIGCGSGALIRSLASEYPGIQFSGIDFSEQLIALAQTPVSPGNLRFICADIVEYQFRILPELGLKGQEVLMLLMGPLEHYHHQDLFTKAVQKIWGEISQGTMIVTYHNKDMWLRGFAKGKGKQYWDEKDSLLFWGGDARLVRSEYFHFFVFDFLISVLQWPWFHGFFLFLERGLRKFPKGFQRRVFMALFHLFQKGSESLHV